MRCELWMVLSASTLLMSSAALAQTPDIEALSEAQREELLKQLERGRVLYEEELYAHALDAFEAAYAIFPHPDVRYRIAKCQDEIGRDEEALVSYRDYLAQSPEAPDRGEVEARISALERLQRERAPALVVTTRPAGAQVSIGAEARGTTPLTLNLAPGTYTVRVTLPGHSAEQRQVLIQYGRDANLTLTLQPEVVGALDPHDSGSGAALPWVFGGIGAAGALTAITCFALYGGAASDVSNYDEQRGAITRPDDYNERVEARNRYGTIALVATGVSVAAFGVATALWLSDDRPVAAWASPEGAGVQVHLSF